MGLSKFHQSDKAALLQQQHIDLLRKEYELCKEAMYSISLFSANSFLMTDVMVKCLWELKERAERVKLFLMDSYGASVDGE